MRNLIAYQYDAFSNAANKGNPSGIVVDADSLTAAEMQSIALQIGFNETAFAMSSDVADLRIRYYTPGHEMDLCGHGTMAMIYALHSKGLLNHNREFTIETNAGLLPIEISDTNEDILITMTQASPQFIPYAGSVQQLASVLGLEEQDIDPELPIVYGSTGIWTLLIPIHSLEAFSRMKPSTQLFPSLLTEIPRASLHPFCLETIDPAADMHARHFSSPYSGTIEDPVTGTASGVMGAYYARFINKDTDDNLSLVVEQGQELGKDGRVQVLVSKYQDQVKIRIAGQAVYVREIEVCI